MTGRVREGLVSRMGIKDWFLSPVR
jgi:hypothetical protein